MKVIFLTKNEFSGKDKREWVKADYLTDKGEVGSVFTSKTDFDTFALSADRFADKRDLDNLFESVASSDISFDNRGRVETVE